MQVCEGSSDLLAHATKGGWDVALMAQTLPTTDEGFSTFLQLRSKSPDLPVVLGARAEEIIGLPRFLKNGLRSYVIRDTRGDFMFLLLAALESPVEAEKASRASLLASMLREELDGVRKLQETIIPRGIHCQAYRAVARYEPSEVNVSGGGLRMGEVIGATNSRAEYPTTQAYSPNDLLATIYRHLGIDPSHHFHDTLGKPVPILASGDAIRALL
ncbi:MAG: DUF1501 domain-containing protein [Gemmataceae bacterium]|nr:DUF1501 domain-containing protein [Gemmataceae bacterium]